MPYNAPPGSPSYGIRYPIMTALRSVSYRAVAPLPTAPPGRLKDGGKIWAKEGLPSADRNNKATLLLTGPFRTAKSSAKDLIPRALKLQYAKYRRASPARRDVRLLRCEAGAYSYPPRTCGRRRRVPAWILT